MKKLVMFDLDGTIVNTIDDLMNATNYALNCLKKPMRSKEEIISFIGDGIRNLVLRALGGDETFINEALQLFKSYYCRHCLDNSIPYAGIIDIMMELKENDIKMAVISNKNDVLTKKICSIFFSEYIDIFIGERATCPRKPAPDALYEVMNYFNIDKEDAIYIGDSEVDVKTAINASVSSISVSYGYRTMEQLKECNASVIVQSVDELKTNLRQMCSI